MSEQVFMDLGDFTEETYEVAFRINGHSYRFSYGEASVDEVLRFLWDEQESTRNVIDRARAIVESFLCGHVVEGDKDQLAIDLKSLPYVSLRGSLSIQQLSNLIQTRIKKKEDGESPERTQEGQSGSSETSAS